MHQRKELRILKTRKVHFMSLKQRITSDLTASMKAQDSARTSTLRMVKAGIVNREIEKGGELDDDELAKLLRSMVKQRKGLCRTIRERWATGVGG